MTETNPQVGAANLPTLFEERQFFSKARRVETEERSFFGISHAYFARAARRQKQNIARYLKPIIVAILMTIVFGIWVFYRWLWQPVWFGHLPIQMVEAFDLFEFGSTITLCILWGIVFWQRYQSKRVKILSVEQLYALSPYDFEQFVGQVFRKKGFNVVLRGRSGDMGVDLELHHNDNGKRAVVQCKRYRNTVGPETVRELYGTMLHERVSHAFLVTTAEISGGGRTWAQNKPLTLIDGETLVRIASELKITPKKSAI